MNYHILTFRFREQDQLDSLKSFTSQAIHEDEVEDFIDHYHAKLIAKNRSLEEVFTNSFTDFEGVTIWLELLHNRDVPFSQKLHRLKEHVYLTKQNLFQTEWMKESALARKRDYDQRAAQARLIRSNY